MFHFHHLFVRKGKDPVLKLLVFFFFNKNPVSPFVTAGKGGVQISLRGRSADEEREETGVCRLSTSVHVPKLHLHPQPPPSFPVSDGRSVQNHLRSHRLPQGLLLSLLLR